MQNLVQNAMQAVITGGRTDGLVIIRLTREDDYWVVDVDDNGPGIPPALRDSVFDPYVTTKSDGTGLGLAIAKKIVGAMPKRRLEAELEPALA